MTYAFPLLREGPVKLIGIAPLRSQLKDGFGIRSIKARTDRLLSGISHDAY